MATITKRGERWRVQIRRRGEKPVSKTFTRKQDAERWARGIEARLDQGEHLLDLTPARQVTLGECLERYEREFTVHKRGRVAEAARIRAWRRHPLAGRALGSIRQHDLAEWRDAQITAGRSPSHIKNTLVVLSNVFIAAAHDWGIPVSNPARGLRLPKQRPGRERRLEGDEEQRLLAAADRVGEPYLPPLIVLAIETACRLSELLGARREHIRGNVLHLPMTKNGRARSVPLSTRALAVLCELPIAMDGRIIPLGTDRVEYVWKKACRLAGIADLHFHDLRHEGTSRLVERGLDMLEVSSITGHITTAMLQRYVHLRAAELAKKLG